MMKVWLLTLAVIGSLSTVSAYAATESPITCQISGVELNPGVDNPIRVGPTTPESVRRIDLPNGETRTITTQFTTQFEMPTSSVGYLNVAILNGDASWGSRSKATSMASVRIKLSSDTVEIALTDSSSQLTVNCKTAK